jgi:serine/threonine protein kinase
MPDPMPDTFRDPLQAALGATVQLGRELGGGGMSRVFLARDTSLGREVVVKVLAPELAQEFSVERFGREIALAAALQHAHIVPVLSAGVTAEGLPFYVMPFVEGASLRDRVTGGRGLPVADVLLVLGDVTRALVYAHGRGVVHRDIKPDNVMLSGGAALVTDFGIAKAMGTARATSAHDGQLTRMGTSIGSPAYMAPEQGAGDPAADHRADLYALGAMAYELLTGQPPFGDRAAHAQLVAHLSEAPVPVTARRPTYRRLWRSWSCAASPRIPPTGRSTPPTCWSPLPMLRRSRASARRGGLRRPTLQATRPERPTRGAPCRARPRPTRRPARRGLGAPRWCWRGSCSPPPRRVRAGATHGRRRRAVPTPRWWR